MTNKEKLIAIIGEENFKKLERNFDPDHWYIENMDELIDRYKEYSIDRAFIWRDSPEGHIFWRKLHEKCLEQWDTVQNTVGTRIISPAEHDLLFKLFCDEALKNNDIYELLRWG